MSVPATLRLTGVSKRFGSYPGVIVRSLQDVDIEVAPAEFVCVIGANGSGKSTLLKIIMGVYAPTAGRVILNGDDVTDLPEHRRARQVALVSQQPGARLAPSLSIEQNMAMTRIPTRAWWRFAITNAEREEFREVLHPLGMGLEDRLRSKVSELSGGQVQALSLATTVGLLKPALLLLDEHCAALDAVMADKVMELTNSVCRMQGASVVMVTHSFEHAAAYGDRLIIMHAGSITDNIPGERKRAMSPRDVFERFIASRRCGQRPHHRGTAGRDYGDEPSILSAG